MTQSPSTNSLAMMDETISSTNTNDHLVSPSSLLQSTAHTSAPIRQRSCDIIDSKLLSSAASKVGNTIPLSTTTNNKTLLQVNANSNSTFSSTNSLNSPPTNNLITTPTMPPHNPNNFLNPAFQSNKSQMRKSATVQNQQTLTNLQKSAHMPPNQKNHNTTSFLSPSSSSKSLLQQQHNQKEASSLANGGVNGGEPLNVLLDPLIINDLPTQALLLTVLATLVRNSSDENEIRILYQYIAEASIVFPKVFPVINQLLDSKINHILQSSMDESILDSVQSIIQNMIYSCDSSGESVNQQQLSYLQSCGFGGLWRFAQPFAVGREKPENVELFIDMLEAMVETCLPQFDTEMMMSGSGGGDSIPIVNNSNNTLVKQNQHRLSTATITSTNTSGNLNTFFNMSSTSSLITTGSMSSISLDHLDRGDVYDLNDMNNFHHHNHNHHHHHRARTNSIRRNSSPRNNMF